MSCAVCFNLIVLSQLYHSCSLLLWKNILIESHFLSNHLSPALLIWRHSCLANKRLVTIAPPTPHIIPQACVVTTHNNHHAMLKQTQFQYPSYKNHSLRSLICSSGQDVRWHHFPNCQAQLQLQLQLHLRAEMALLSLLPVHQSKLRRKLI